MREVSYEQWMPIVGVDFVDTVEKLNVAVREVGRGYIETTMIDECKYLVKYKAYLEVPETKRDFRELNGTEVKCINCPHYRPILNADGTLDKRTDKGICAKWGYKVYQKGKADDKCYEMFAEEAAAENISEEIERVGA